jgi:hypothetical protein
MLYVFKGEKLGGKSLEQLAVEDYPKFRWMRKNATKLPEEWLKRMDDIIYALDNFESKEKCVVCKQRPVKYLSIVESYYPKDISVSLAYAYCSKECANNDQSALALIEGRAHLYEAKYSVIFSNFCWPSWPKSIIKELHGIMYKLLAGDMRKTKKELYELINSILLRRANEQPMFLDGY